MGIMKKQVWVVLHFVRSSIISTRHLKKKAVRLYVAGLILFFGCFLLFTRQSPTSQEISQTWRSRSVDTGLLRVMRYIEREGEIDGALRDAFVDRIWRSIKLDIVRDLVHKSKANFTTHRGKNDSRLDLLLDLFQENSDILNYFDGSHSVVVGGDQIASGVKKSNKDIQKDSDGRNGNIYSDEISTQDVKKIVANLDRNGDEHKSFLKTKELHNRRLKDVNLETNGKQNSGLLSPSSSLVSSSKSKKKMPLPMLGPFLFTANRQRRPSLSSSLSTSLSLSKDKKLVDQTSEKNSSMTRPKKVDLDKFSSLPTLNPFVFSYNYGGQSNACSANTIDVIIAVPTAPGNFERRENVRKSNTALFANNPLNRAKLLFFMGIPDPTLGESSRKFQEHIDKEQARYGDLVQAAFVDSYGNLTKKAAQLLHWSSTYCQNGKYLIRTDDDVTVNISKMIQAMEQQQSKYANFILGNMKVNWEPVRDINSKYSKYFLSYEDYPYKRLPPFLLGGALGYPIKTAGLLLEAMRRVPLTWLDDVFVTGICARKVGVPIVNSGAFKFGHDDEKET